MGSREKRDVYYRLAKEHELRARSAFKLLQIDKHLGIFDGVTSVVDLCAAPGGWSILSRNIIQRRLQHECSDLKPTVVAVDVVPIYDIPGVECIVGDITHPSTAQQIINAVDGRTDLVIFDGAPEVTGLVESDQWQQHMLVEMGALLCTQILRPGGTYVAKVFRGSRTVHLYRNLQRLFGQVVITKPQTSRNSSLEVFITCRNFVNMPIFQSIALDEAFSLGLGTILDCISQDTQQYSDVTQIAVDFASGGHETCSDNLTAPVQSSICLSSIREMPLLDAEELLQKSRVCNSTKLPSMMPPVSGASSAPVVSDAVLAVPVVPFVLCGDLYDADQSYSLKQELPYDVYGYIGDGAGDGQEGEGGTVYGHGDAMGSGERMEVGGSDGDVVMCDEDGLKVNEGGEGQVCKRQRI